MRILHVLDHSLPLHSGYTFRTRAILKAQVARGWDVMGVTGWRHYADGPDPQVADELTFGRTAKGLSAPAPLGELLEINAFSRRIGRAIESFRPDIVHAHSPVLGALAALNAVSARKLPLVYEIRAFWEDAAVGNGTGTEGSVRFHLTKALETWAVKRADAVAVICEGLRSDLVARGISADKIVVSPNGVDLSLFGAPIPPDPVLAAELGLSGAEVVGYIGSFYDYEGIDTLIAAMPALVAARPTAKLLLVGGGPMEPALRAQTAASAVADRIVFVGRVPHERVEDYYALTDVLAYPRKKMRLTDLVTPLKPLEAMAQRRLVVASDVGGHRELIEHGVTGTLFAADDPTAAAAALVGVFADRPNWEARRDRARDFVEAERDWASNIARYEPVYQKLLVTAR
jgi:glycogen synthase